MLRTRVITAVILSAILLLILWLPPIAFGIAVLIIALLGVSEFYNAISNVGYKPIRIVGFVSCFSILLITLNGVSLSGSIAGIQGYIDLFKSLIYFSLGLFIIMLILFLFIVFLNEKYNVNDIAITVFGIFYVVFLLAFLVLTRNLDNGIYYIWFIFIGAWGTDTSAYLFGRLFGKKSILPTISPKKTVEGTIGGIIGSIVLTMGYAILLKEIGILSVDTSVLIFAVLGLLNGVISQISDWGASAIKRHSNIKDFGKIFPGHGGVLDRFDSILFVSPVVYFFISFIHF